MFPLPFNFPFRKSDGSLTTLADAISSGGGSYTLPTASADTKGGVKIGAGLTMEGEVLKNTNPTPYTLPVADASQLGGIKVGSGLTIDESGILSASGGGGSSKHVHNIILTPTATSTSARIQCIVINDSSTPFTLESFNGYLRENNYYGDDTKPAYPATGRFDVNPVYGVQGLTGSSAATSIQIASIAIVSGAHARSVTQAAVALTDTVS